MAKSCFEEWLWDLAYIKTSTFTMTMVSLLLMSFMQIALRSIIFRVFQALVPKINMSMLSVPFRQLCTVIKPHVTFSFHWSKYSVDDLALWSFTFIHDTWLLIGYIVEQQDSLWLNCSPRLVLIIKIFTEHVWRCHTFDLDPKLRNV